MVCFYQTRFTAGTCCQLDQSRVSCVCPESSFVHTDLRARLYRALLELKHQELSSRVSGGLPKAKKNSELKKSSKTPYNTQPELRPHLAAARDANPLPPPKKTGLHVSLI